MLKMPKRPIQEFTATNAVTTYVRKLHLNVSRRQENGRRMKMKE